MADSSSTSSRSASDHEAEPMDPTAYVVPTPYKWGVLRRRIQRTHVSQVVWNGGSTPRVLKTRRGTVKGGPDADQIPDVVSDMLRAAGFLHVARMRNLQMDSALISALVERWRPETHTFHTPQGEMTITLEDVAGILGLPTEGDAVTGVTVDEWETVIEEVFGHEPEDTELRGGYLRLSYFDRHFAHWGEVVPEPVHMTRFTKAHIARLIGSWLLCDRSGGSMVAARYMSLLAGDFVDIGRYSWGSAVLSHLFRQMCECTDPDRSDIGGCHMLLQVWAWLRFPPIAPAIPLPTQPDWHFGHRFNAVGRLKPHELVVYRMALDSLTRNEVVWQPYGDYDFLGASERERLLWMATTPIICFHTVEYCQPDRCMRQFGRDQPIPRAPRKLKGVHDLSLRGKREDNWTRKLRPFIERWDARDQHIQLPPLIQGLLSPHHEYMV